MEECPSWENSSLEDDYQGAEISINQYAKN